MAEKLCRLLAGTHSRVEDGVRTRYVKGSTIVLSDEELESDTFRGRAEVIGGETVETETPEPLTVETPTPRRKRY